MTDDEIRKMAKAAGLPKIMWDTRNFREFLAAFVDAAVLAEREACAMLCEAEAAAAIRLRSNV